MSTSPNHEKKTRLCVVPVCAGERFDLVHKFPNDNNRAEKWKRILNIPLLEKLNIDIIRRRYFVCNRHFLLSDYKNIESRGLNKTALPSLNIRNLDNLDIVERNRKIREGKLNEINNESNEIIISEVITENEEYLEEELPPENSIKRKADFELESIESVKRLNTENLIKTLQPIPKESLTNEIIENDVEDEVEEIIDTQETIDDTIEDTLNISHPDFDGPLKFHNIWLRDHCKCDECFDIETNLRKFDILDIPLDISRKSFQIDDRKFIILWSDGHLSQYHTEEICQLKLEIYREELLKEQNEIIWKNPIELSSQFIHVNLNDYLSDDNKAKSIITSLLQYGIAFIEKVPSSAQSTEMAIKRLFPLKRLYDQTILTNSHYTSENTNKLITPHTTGIYLEDCPGLIAMHCLNPSKSGGESIFVDGFKILDELKLSYPEEFKILIDTTISHEYNDDEYNYKNLTTTIELNNIIGMHKSIKYDPISRSTMNTIPHNKIIKFYKAYRLLTKLIRDKENELCVKLESGTIVLINNLRILHGHREYNGKRIMCCGFVSKSDFLCAARRMKCL